MSIFSQINSYEKDVKDRSYNFFLSYWDAFDSLHRVMMRHSSDFIVNLENMVHSATNENISNSEFEKIEKRLDSNFDSYNQCNGEFNELFKKYGEEKKEIFYSCINGFFDFKPINPVELKMLKKRYKIFLNKMNKMYNSFEDYFICIIKEFNDEIEFNNNFIENRSNEIFNREVIDEHVEQIKNDIKNIYNWKELETLALKNNYEYKWNNGDHKIYEHKETMKIVVIPTHELGKGLSRKIQKQIYNNLLECS